MIELARCVRFWIPLHTARVAPGPVRHNTFAGGPGVDGMGVYGELELRCDGEPDRRTGYLVNISAIDVAVREHGVPLIAEAVREAPDRDPRGVLRAVTAAVMSAVRPRVTGVTWRMSPFLSLTMETAAMDRVLLSEQFSFAAAHRLHCADLDDDENRRIFGKCNNLHGHGHNYKVEVAVVVPVADAAGSGEGFGVPTLERLVHERVIERFDHTHLNLDTAEFADVVPSVENIARVCHGLLAEPIAAAGGELRAVTVWETEKTRCTFPAPLAVTPPSDRIASPMASARPGAGR